MELLTFIKGLDDSDLDRFAAQVGTTIGHLRNCAYGGRVPSAALAAQIEIASAGRVPVTVTRPKDWHLIWDPRKHHLIDKADIVTANGVEPNGVAEVNRRQAAITPEGQREQELSHVG